MSKVNVISVEKKFINDLSRKIHQVSHPYATVRLLHEVEQMRYSPGIFVYFTYISLTKKTRTLKKIIGYSINIEFLHIARRMQDAILFGTIKKQPDRDIFESILARLTAGASGMEGIAELNKIDMKIMCEIIPELDVICRNEIASLNNMVHSNDRKCNVNYCPNESSIDGAIAIGATLAGRKIGKQLRTMSASLSFALNLWEKGCNQNFPRRDLLKLDLIAEKSFEKWEINARNFFGKDSSVIMYASLCRKRLRKEVGL